MGSIPPAQSHVRGVSGSCIQTASHWILYVISPHKELSPTYQGVMEGCDSSTSGQLRRTSQTGNLDSPVSGTFGIKKAIRLLRNFLYPSIHRYWSPTLFQRSCKLSLNLKRAVPVALVYSSSFGSRAAWGMPPRRSQLNLATKMSVQKRALACTGGWKLGMTEVIIILKK